MCWKRYVGKLQSISRCKICCYVDGSMWCWVGMWIMAILVFINHHFNHVIATQYKIIQMSWYYIHITVMLYECHRNSNHRQLECLFSTPDSKFHGANMGPIWGRQDPGGPHVGPINFAIWDLLHANIKCHITGPLWGISTGDRSIPLTKC